MDGHHGGRLLQCAILSLQIVAGCAQPAPGHPSGPSSPQRIVSMTPALTEILFAVGLGEKVVGVTDYCDHPPEAARRARIGGYVNPSVEAILDLHPDLVLVSPAAGNREAALAVRRAGVRLEVIPAESLSEAFAAMESVARICGAEERGRQLLQSVQERIDAVAAKARSLPRVRTLFCVQIDPLIAAGRGTLPSELLELAGGTNIVAAARYPRVGIETVLAEAPEVILQARMDVADPSAARSANAYWSQWASVPAVKQHRVFVFDATIALRPGPRVAEAVELLARLLHGGPS